MKRCVIIGGAPINRYDRVLPYLKDDDYLIYCDSGLKHLPALQKAPDLIVGDFDSWEDPRIQKEAAHAGAGSETSPETRDLSSEQTPEELNSIRRVPLFDLSNYQNVKETRIRYCYDGVHSAPAVVIPPEKYDTDTRFGTRQGLNMGFEEFLLLGVIGNRLDHSLANLSILLMLDGEGKKGKIVDDYSEMEIVSSGPGFIEDRFSTFSLLNLTGLAEEIRIEDAKYCFLPHERIDCEFQYGVSNEVLPGRTAKVTVGKGRVLLIRNFQEEEAHE